MITLLIPGIAKLIQGTSAPEEIYRRLKGHWYLSISGLRNRDDALDVIQQTIDDYPKEPIYGGERCRSIIDALISAGYINILGRTWGMIGRRR